MVWKKLNENLIQEIHQPMNYYTNLNVLKLDLNHQKN